MRTVHWDPTSHVPSPHHPKQDWEKLYRAAVLELDQGRLPQRIAQAQAAILNRSQRLAGLPPVSGREQDAIIRALHILHLLRKTAA